MERVRGMESLHGGRKRERKGELKLEGRERERGRES